MHEIQNILLKSMDLIVKRHELLSNNIANIDTENYERKDINFEKEIKKILKSEDIKNYEPEIIKSKSVKVENEILEVSKNVLLFNSITKILILKQKILESSINTTTGV